MCRYSLQFLGGYLFHVCHLPFSLLALRSIFLRISRIDGQSQKIVFLLAAKNRIIYPFFEGVKEEI